MATGQDLFNKGLLCRGQNYILNIPPVPKNDNAYNGPWNCSEFVSWAVYQVSVPGRLYGCDDDNGNPANERAYSGDWKLDAEGRIAGSKIITVTEAGRTPGAAILRVPSIETNGQLIGHVVISDGNGGTMEARGAAYGVNTFQINGNRRWDYGILIPWITYTINPASTFTYIPPQVTVYRLSNPMMVSETVGKIQTALSAKGFSPQGIDNIYGVNTMNAVFAFQAANKLVCDGEVGVETAKALGVVLN